MVPKNVAVLVHKEQQLLTQFLAGKHALPSEVGTGRRGNNSHENGRKRPHPFYIGNKWPHIVRGWGGHGVGASVAGCVVLSSLSSLQSVRSIFCVCFLKPATWIATQTATAAGDKKQGSVIHALERFGYKLCHHSSGVGNIVPPFFHSRLDVPSWEWCSRVEWKMRGKRQRGMSPSLKITTVSRERGRNMEPTICYLPYFKRFCDINLFQHKKGEVFRCSTPL